MARKRKASKASSTSTKSVEITKESLPSTGAFRLSRNTELTARNATLPRPARLNPLKISVLIRAYSEGKFDVALPTLETMVLTDAHLAMCIEKRVGHTVYNDYEFLYEDGLSDEEKKQAQTQIDYLRDLFSTIKVSNVKAQDEELGVQGLIRHLLGAIGYGYAVCAMNFYPSTALDGSPTDHVQFLTCPLSFFEAKERRLRIREDYFSSEGKKLKGSEWLVAHYPSVPLLIPSLKLFAEKNSTMEDWVRTVEKFGTPFVYANTSASKNSDDWVSTCKSVTDIGSGFSGVFGSDVQISTANLAQGNAPHERLIDYLDRSLARLWLGNDLSSMSRAQDSIGSYAQAGEQDALCESDRIFVEQILDLQVVKPFLARVFGEQERQLVYFKFKRKEEAKDMSATIARLQQATDMGLPIPLSFLYGELEIPEPMEGEEVFQPQQQQPQQGQNGEQEGGEKTPEQELEEALQSGDIEEEQEGEEPEEQEATNEALEDNPDPAQREILRKLQKVSNEQFAPLLEKLQAIEACNTEEDFKNALRNLRDTFPAYKRDILSKTDLADAMSECLFADWKQS